MSLTPAAAETLRQALATVVVVPVTPLLCRACVRPPSRPLPPHIQDEISAILASWGLV